MPSFPTLRELYTAVSESDGATLAEIADALFTGQEIAMWATCPDGDHRLA